MLKKTIKFVDYNGVQREEDFYFNLSKAEVVEMEMSTSGGLAEMIQNIVKAEDSAAIIKIFKDLILKSYGEKTLDGKRFVKVDPDGNPLYRKFMETEAFSELFMELATDADAGAKFVNGIMPADVANKAQLPNASN